MSEGLLERFMRECEELSPLFRNPYDKNDAPFESYLRLEPEQGRRVCEALKPTLRSSRERDWTASEAALLPRRVSMVVANAHRALLRNTPAHYPRGKSHFQAGQLGHPAYAGLKPMLKVIDALHEVGLVQSVKAPAIPGFPKRSTLIGTPALATFMCELGIGEPSFDHCFDERRFVELRGQDGERIAFSYGAEQTEIECLLRDYNRFLANQRIELPSTGGHPRILDGFQTAIFNNGSWDQGGRTYADYQNLTKRCDNPDRPRLLINGRAVVEPDYSAFQPRLCYHLLGIDYRDDPYSIPSLWKYSGGWLTQAQMRPIAKIAMVIMINRCDREGLGRHWEKFGIDDSTRVECKQVFKVCEHHHTAIAPLMYQGVGMELMNIEARICRSILRQALEAGIAVLPVHDSFIVAGGYEDWLMQAMYESYYQEVGFDPVVSL